MLKHRLYQILKKRAVYNTLAAFILSKHKRKAFRARVQSLIDLDWVRQRQAELRARAAKKDKLDVLFIVSLHAIWPYDRLYNLMAQDSRFNPVIVVIPYRDYAAAHAARAQEETRRYFEAQGIAPVIASEGLEKRLAPDIVFFTSHHDIFDPEWHMSHWWDKALCVYVPYGIMQVKSQQTQYNKDFHQYAWKCYYETELHREMARKYARNKGDNVVVTGYPKNDLLFDAQRPQKPAWKPSAAGAKKLIWAPHWTIGSKAEKGDSDFSNFLLYSDWFLGLAARHRGRLQIAFKPHPNLKSELYKRPDWGIARTDAYYAGWAALENGQLEEGAYADLFLQSDAMVLDSISFIAEYTFIGKPLAFMENGVGAARFNEFGAALYDTVYKTHAPQDVEAFIANVVLGGDDPGKERRDAFVRGIQPPGGLGHASENILNDIAISVWGEKGAAHGQNL